MAGGFDSDFGLTLLGIVSIILIIGIILFVSQKIGIQTYNVLEVGSPCDKLPCSPGLPAREVSRDWDASIAYCGCPDGRVITAPLFL